MAYAASGLARLGGANGFSLWHYKTADAKAAVDTSGYFNDAANMLNVGDVVISYDTATPTVTLMVVLSNDGAAVDVSDGTAISLTDTD